MYTKSKDKLAKDAIGSPKIVRKRTASLKPSPENESLYRSTDDDPDITELVYSIRHNGLRERLVVTADGYIVSGHRRHAALLRIGRAFAECEVLPKRRSDYTREEYIALLRDYNRQRYKTVAEQVRETLVDMNPDDCYEELLQRRNETIYAPSYSRVEELAVEGSKRRWGISDQKSQHVEHIKKVVFEDRRDYWPLTVRTLHYALLNYTFLRNTKEELPYKNDDKSYQATSELITRLRLSGVIPWEAFDDTTRPFKDYSPFQNARQFVRQEVERLFDGYWRDLLQSQENRFEVICEKNTVFHLVERVTRKYQIPTVSGRGFGSIDAWYDVAERFKESGKQRLILIMLTDYDPEGLMIPHVGGRTLRDDFEIGRVAIVRAAVTAEQIADHNLPEQNFAKEKSSNYDWFVSETGGTSVYELEALPPDVLLASLDSCIRGVIDVDLYNREVEAERDEAAYLQASRNRAHEALRGMDR